MDVDENEYFNNGQDDINQVDIIGGKKINVIGNNNIQLTPLEYENLLENIMINGEYLYSQEDIIILTRLYTNYISKLINTKKGDEITQFLLNELLFQYYIPILIAKDFTKDNIDIKVSQKYINVQKNILKKRNIGVIKHIEVNDKEKHIEREGKRIQLNYPINLIIIITNNNLKFITREDIGHTIYHEGIIMPSHNISIRSSILENHYKKYPIKDIFLSGYYSYNIPFRKEYSQFITSHTYKLSDNRSILPILFPYYGKSNKSRILLYKEYTNTYSDLIKYNNIIIKYAETSTSCIYNNLIYRYFPDKLESLLGKGIIRTPNLILNAESLGNLDVKFKEFLHHKFNIILKLDKYFLLDELGHLKNLYYYGVEDNDIKIFKNNLESSKKIADQNNDLIKVKLNKILYKQSAIFTVGKDPDLVKLNESEKKIVENEVKKRMNLQNNTEVNKCGHVELLNKVMNSSKYQIIEYSFNKLINYLIIPKNLMNPELDQTIKIETVGKESIDILQCSSCKFDVICPHLYHKFILELKYISPTSKVNVLIDIKNFLVRNYVDASSTDFSYYCRICGGKIAEDTSVMDIMPDVNLAGEFITFNEDETDETISKIIYSFASTIIKNNISFKTIIDPKLVINAVLKMIKHEIRHIYSLKVAKSGSNFSDYSLYPYVLINVVIAVLLIITNRKERDIIFTENKNKNIAMDLLRGGATTSIRDNDIKLFQENFNIATKIIMQNKMIFDKNEIPLDHIKQLITIAYKRLSLEGVEPPVLNSDIKFLNLINIYPLYDYLYNHARLHGKNIARDNVDEILKLSKNQILSGNYKNRTFSIEHVKKFNSNGDKILDYKQKVIENLFGEFIDLNIFLQEYGQINRVEFYDKYEALINEEKLLYGNWKERFYKSIIPMSGILLSRFSYDKSEVRLGVAYDENGNKRKWNEFVYSSGVKKVGSIPDGMKPLSIKDKKSGNNYLSKISVNGNNKIRDGLEFNDLINNFYIYYQFRCPNGSIHQFSKNSCKKCGVLSEDLENRNIGYFNKYKNIYLKRKSLSTIKSDFKIPQLNNIKKVNKFNEEGYNNITFVGQVAKTFGQSENVLLNLGLMEKVDIKDLTQIKVNPYNEKTDGDTIYYTMNQSRDEVRINKLKQYINMLLIYYELVLSFNVDLMVPAHAEIMKKYVKFISIKGNILRKVLPNIHEKWDKFLGSEQFYPNKLYGNKLLKFLYAALIELTEIKGDKDVVGIAKDFAHWFMKHIINIETMTSMYNIDQLRRDRTESYNKVRDELDKDRDLVQNEVLEVIQLYDPELASTDKHEIENNLADSSFEMTIDVDENNGPDAGDD